MKFLITLIAIALLIAVGIAFWLASLNNAGMTTDERELTKPLPERSYNDYLTPEWCSENPGKCKGFD